MASLEGHRLQWLSDQLVEPTNLVFAIVIASSLELYRDVLDDGVELDRLAPGDGPLPL